MSGSSGGTKDNILEFFVQAANQHDFTLDITLNVKGSVITGTLISANEYFNTLSETFEEGNEIAQFLSEQLAEAGQAAQNNNSSEAYFIHMKETKVYCGDSKPTPSKGEFLWRGKLAEIDGFFLGKIFEGNQKEV
ncbi:gas vesicle protein GvpU [Lysinibacillus yapensis]|uniref:Gas vesicle protein GvpU n=1 Tax=Ureibacillus yapensis TaxID=2304605 RepID=A0A396S3J0_9BACL|nr:gas vesicle accessory protein GvpU [Lysinibacillus yapensis]RHW33208.1 gas vesicle protein GvpU [Lysinibacillus yapensis]